MDFKLAPNVVDLSQEQGKATCSVGFRSEKLWTAKANCLTVGFVSGVALTTLMSVLIAVVL